MQHKEDESHTRLTSAQPPQRATAKSGGAPNAMARTGIIKSRIDWIPLPVGSVRLTQGKTLAVMEVSGGRHPFNAVNQTYLVA